MFISVICPVYNTDPDLLMAAVYSVRNQAGNHDIDLIIVDDGSTRVQTLDCLRLIISDGHARVLTQSANAGPAAARMSGVAAAQSDWLGFIDSDDLWPLDKIDLAAAAVVHVPGAKWICGQYYTIYRDREVLEQALPISFDQDRTALTRRLITAMPPLGASLIRAETFHSAGGLEPSLIYGEDWLFYLRLSTIAAMTYVDAPVYRLRRQQASLMWSYGRMSDKFVAATRLARLDPRLACIKRELRWFLYANYKDIAMNNVLNSRPLHGLYFAGRALSVDVREVRQFMLFCKAAASSRDKARKTFLQYSTSEQILLDQLTVNTSAASPAEAEVPVVNAV